MEFVLNHICINGDTDNLPKGEEEPGKPVRECPNYYLGRFIGTVGNELKIFRKRRGGEMEFIPNYVLYNENGIAVIRLHKVEKIQLTRLPDADGDVRNCNQEEETDYPPSMVIIDYRSQRYQMAIERSEAWNYNTQQIGDSLAECFNSFFKSHFGLELTISEKSIATKCEEFIDERLMTQKDAITSFTVSYANELRVCSDNRIPEELTPLINAWSTQLEFFGLLKGKSTLDVNDNLKTEKLKVLSKAVSYCCGNGMDLSIDFRDYGRYRFNEEIQARFTLNELALTTFINRAIPEMHTVAHDLVMWLDDVYERVAQNGWVYAVKKRRKRKGQAAL